MPFGLRSNPEWCYILGDFGVKVRGARSVLTRPPETLAFGSVVPQGLPFYGGNITYHIPIELPRGAKGLRIAATHFRGALVAAFARPAGCKEGKVTQAEEEIPLMLPPYEGGFCPFPRGDGSFCSLYMGTASTVSARCIFPTKEKTGWVRTPGGARGQPGATNIN